MDLHMHTTLAATDHRLGPRWLEEGPQTRDSGRRWSDAPANRSHGLLGLFVFAGLEEWQLASTKAGKVVLIKS